MWKEFDRFALSEGGRVALNEHKSGVLVATKSENCRCVDGALHGGLGVKYLENAIGWAYAVPLDMQCVAFVNCGEKHKGLIALPLYLDAKGVPFLYSADTNSFHKVYDAVSGMQDICPDPVNFQTKNFFAVNKLGFFYLNEDGLVFQKADIVNGSVCTFADRVFYACKQGVCFSDVGNYSDFSDSAYGAGKIDFFDGEGHVDKIIPYGNAILVVKNSRLFLFHAAGAADQFSVETLDYSSGKIVEKSAVRCGKYVLFITENGAVVRLHGKTCVKLVERLPDDFCSKSVRTAADGEHFFISCGKSTLVVNAENGSSYISFSLDGMSTCDGTVVGAYEGYLCEFAAGGEFPFGQTATYSVQGWLAEDETEKQLEKVRLFGQGALTLRLSDGRANVQKSVELDPLGVEVELELRGRAFELSVNLEPTTCLRKIAVQFHKGGSAV
jgi:hypothetical protein